MELPPSSLHAFQLLFFFLALLFPISLCWNSLIPPVGNSLSIKTKTLHASQSYRCIDGDWTWESTQASLVGIHDSAQIVANYSRFANPQIPRYAGTWSFLNSDGDRAESGSTYSIVSGKQVFSAKRAAECDLADFLAMATMHQHQGAASMVSYIAAVNTRGGVPLKEGCCEHENELIKLPFKTEFHFWKQDLAPPSTPNSLTVVSDRAVEGFFGSGMVTYIFEGTRWVQKNMYASLYDVPGGTKVGNYFIKSSPDDKGGSYCWNIDNPNGFEIVGKQSCAPVQVTAGSLPWSLNVVTSSNGNSSMFGPYTHIQMVSTTGGMPPSNPALTPQQGQVWKSSFTAIYWFYCKGAV